VKNLLRSIFVSLMIVSMALILSSKSFAQAPQCQELSHNSCSVLPSSTYKAFCTFPDGAVYEGDMDCYGYITGRGEIINKDGSTYSGSWRQGHYHGEGVLQEGGLVISGNFVQGALTGIGRVQSADGSISSGKFLNGMLNGPGEARFADGSVQKGQFLNGFLEGNGEVTYPDQSYIRGSFKRGRLNGKGEIGAGDENLSGIFRDGLLVQGKMRTKQDGAFFEREGNFRNEQLQGEGIVRVFDNSGNLVATTTGSYTDGFLEGAFYGETFEAGKLLFSEKGSSKKGVPYGSLKRDYVDGSADFVEMLEGWAAKTTSYLPDASVFFRETDENNAVVTAKWIEPPAAFFHNQYYTEFLTLGDKSDARKALRAIKDGQPISNVAEDFGTFVRDAVYNKSIFPAADASWKKLYQNMEQAKIGEPLRDVHCFETATSLTLCDVVVLKKVELGAAATEKKKQKTAPLKPKNDNPANDRTFPLVQAASGSGFFITENGIAVTNSHVIDSCKKVTIKSNGEELIGTVLADDKVNDVAVLKFNLKTDGYLGLAKENGQLMDEIYVAGFPFGDAISSSLKVTKGIVSSVSGIGNNFSQMQIDAALQPGNSGGPVVNQNGNVIGIAVAKLDFKQVLKNFGTLPEDTNFAVKLTVLQSILSGLNIKVTESANKKASSRALGEVLTRSTVNLACYMNKEQLDELQTVRSIIKTD
jgi:S1-C subfamily serine protease